MLATTRSRGAAASAAAPTGSPAVSAPSLSASRRASSSALSTSPLFQSTSKYCLSRSITSGKIGRATRIFCIAILRVSRRRRLYRALASLRCYRYRIDTESEKQPGHNQEHRHQHDHSPAEIREKTWHTHAARLRDRFHHEVRRVADIAVRAHEHRTRRY